MKECVDAPSGALQEFLWQGPGSDVAQLDNLPLPCNASMMPSACAFGQGSASMPLASTVIALPMAYRALPKSEQPEVLPVLDSIQQVILPPWSAAALHGMQSVVLAEHRPCSIGVIYALQHVRKSIASCSRALVLCSPCKSMRLRENHCAGRQAECHSRTIKALHTGASSTFTP